MNRDDLNPDLTFEVNLIAGRIRAFAHLVESVAEANDQASDARAKERLYAQLHAIGDSLRSLAAKGDAIAEFLSAEINALEAEAKKTRPAA